MSVVGDVILGIEVAARLSIGGIPPGDQGRTFGWTDAGALTSERFSHLVIWDPSEKSTTLPYRQKRVEVGIRVALIRRGSDFNGAASDWESLRAYVVADPTLGGLVDDSDLTLESIEDPVPEFDFTVATMAFAAFKEL